jgi:hypothetical protein
LAATICEHLGWYTAGGGPKGDACEKLLLKLEERGLLRLPKNRAPWERKRIVPITQRSCPRPPVVGSLAGLGALRLEPVEGESKKLFNEYLQRYHPLGYRQPFGYRMRYFIETDRGKLGCLLFSGAAKSLGARDRWIGWTPLQPRAGAALAAHPGGLGEPLGLSSGASGDLRRPSPAPGKLVQGGGLDRAGNEQWRRAGAAWATVHDDAQEDLCQSPVR